MELFVAEKPSVARYLAQVLSGGYEKKGEYYEGKDGRIYGAAQGHLVKCVSPDEVNEEWGWRGNTSKLPFFMEDIPLKVIDEPSAKTKYKTLVDLMKKADIIYVATDAGREGEHIFRKILKKSGVKGKELKRLWIRKMTAEGVLKAFEDLKDLSEYDGLALSGQLREESDLLIGINATILATKLSESESVLSLGRVQTPTLFLIVGRDMLIENFTKVKHFSVIAKDQKGNTFELVLDKETHLSKEEADKLLQNLGNRRNLDIEDKLKKEKPQKLFDLTSLQKYMNKKYKWTAKKTLDVTQKLYEKQYVTYPRTSSQYIAGDEELPQVLKAHEDNEVIKRILDLGYKIEPSFVNPEKVSDHEAIIITTNPKGDNIVGDESLLYDIIFKRFAAAFYPPAVKKETIASFDDGEYKFKAKESILIEKGWKEIFDMDLETGNLAEIQLSDIGGYHIIEKETKPPSRYTEASLLGDMENAAKFLMSDDDKKTLKKAEGIGTVATRDSIIELLIRRGYIERVKNNLVSTELGRKLIQMMPEDFLLTKVQATAYLETLLSEIQEGNMTANEFYKELQQFVLKTCSDIKANVKTISMERESITKCKKCGSPIYENKKVYSCSNKECKVILFKNGLEKLGKASVTQKEASKLLNGSIVKVKLKSKNKSWTQPVVFNFEKNWIEFAEKK
ncbi:DNA topoisomerase [Bacillus velezensis]|uniref:DNA topoisomerase n=1 Tax=Bacillus velezensis TaxID=492670 RepID=UPI0035578BA2